MELLQLLRDNAVLLGPAGALVGFVAGHRFALFRDRRRERNEVAREIRLQLLSHSRHPTPYRNVASDDDLEVLARLSPWWRRGAIRQCARQYRQACDQDTHADQLGQVFYNDPARVTVAATQMLKFVQHT